MREALHILAARPSSHEHDHHEHEHAPSDADASSFVASCHDQGAPTKDAVNWGQRISLESNDDEDDNGEIAAASIAEQKEKLEQEIHCTVTIACWRPSTGTDWKVSSMVPAARLRPVLPDCWRRVWNPSRRYTRHRNTPGRHCPRATASAWASNYPTGCSGHAMNRSSLRGLYAITDAALQSPERLVPHVQQAIDGGAVLIQYRDKSNDTSLRQQQARSLVELCNARGATLIINDDTALAAAVSNT